MWVEPISAKQNIDAKLTLWQFFQKFKLLKTVIVLLLTICRLLLLNIALGCSVEVCYGLLLK